MLSLSQSTGYAVIAMACMEKCKGKWIQAQEIAGCTGIPLPYLLKVLNWMTRQGLVVSKRGYRGGFYLARPSSEISVLDIAEAVEGPDLGGECLLGLQDCRKEFPCPFHAFWEEERERIRAMLKATTLGDVGMTALAGRQAKTKRPACDDEACGCNPPPRAIKSKTSLQYRKSSIRNGKRGNRP
jgi:Rrf2 family protein